MKRRTIALASLLLLLGSSYGYAAPIEDTPVIGKYDNKVIEFVQLKTYANLMSVEEVKVNDKSKKYSMVPFTAVSKGQKLTPILYSTILDAPVSEALSLEIVILDPDNKQIQSLPLTVNTKEKNTNLTLINTLDSMTFDKTGGYKIQLFVRWNEHKVNIGNTLIVSK